MASPALDAAQAAAFSRCQRVCDSWPGAFHRSPGRDGCQSAEAAARTRYAPSEGVSCTSFPTSSISRVPALRACHCGISSRPLWPNKAHRLSTSYTRWRGVCKEALIAVLDHPSACKSTIARRRWYGSASLRRGWIAPPGHGRLGAGSYDTLDRVIAWPSFKAEKTHRGDLMWGKTRVGSPQVNDQLAQIFREIAPRQTAVDVRSLGNRLTMPSCSNWSAL